MNSLSAFGLFAVTAMLVCYALEQRSPWFILAFAASCALGSLYGFLHGAWPCGLVEAIYGRSWRCAVGTMRDPVRAFGECANRVVVWVEGRSGFLLVRL